ncbi:MAG: bifunctional DNA-formamidopyrimidine glycosylase/DNA-(apurinic or apyrimidinic site) lyase [Acetobacter sp.]|nr:bifunctional DNA-formamidopyrimidine glycosylase/DNA-(apurinic or apyrimidinic site) lyase [Bacteroides sp.]MCM1340991.1 bifunctional DNA-formamidopyrimidine glycosylase/DNA-(apurinic or apyrimidinic site) lyase [Acetobacter sp.]MCM1432453.1 bifunctional DNA-formamidopyrimidine glycosylase/DNA-(apurinic or apyrimidinic site) lyase [Clostridiales bacterium]
MPELPEVETIKNVIKQQIEGLKIDRLLLERPEIIAHPTAEEFCNTITGQIISSMSRRGKFIIINLNSGDCVIIHLRMTGCLLVTPSDYPKETHTHIIFSLSNSTQLRFSDTRRFGRFWLIRDNETDIYSGIHKLGIEPFDDELTAQYLQKNFGKRKKAIKECLLNQSVVAGIGNIYSDEILFKAKINPSRSANSLSQIEWKMLADVIPERLSYFIERNVITPFDYLETKGKEYRNTPFLQVYGHSNQPCPVCESILIKTVIGGRSSVFCPDCQK